MLVFFLRFISQTNPRCFSFKKNSGCPMPVHEDATSYRTHPR